MFGRKNTISKNNSASFDKGILISSRFLGAARNNGTTTNENLRYKSADHYHCLDTTTPSGRKYDYKCNSTGFRTGGFTENSADEYCCENPRVRTT